MHAVRLGRAGGLARSGRWGQCQRPRINRLSLREALRAPRKDKRLEISGRGYKPESISRPRQVLRAPPSWRARTRGSHPLRARCTALGRPICHDQIYPGHLPENTDDYRRPLPLLAKSLAFTDPISGEVLRSTGERTLAWPEPDLFQWEVPLSRGDPLTKISALRIFKG